MDTSRPDPTDALTLKSSATENLRSMVDMIRFVDRKSNPECVFMCTGTYSLARKTKKSETMNDQCRTPIMIQPKSKP